MPVASVRAVVGPPEQRCWVERQQVTEERSDAPNVPGAIAGAVIGGVLGHQIGGGRGKDVATVGGAAAGAVIGANVGRGGTYVRTDDVQRATPLIEQLLREHGFQDDALIEAMPLEDDEEEDDEEDDED